jgi:aminoglycoside phosphotransferase (APT) family kinase protein
VNLSGPASQDDHSSRSGVDLARVEPWLAARMPSLTPPFEFELVAGGRSNLTFIGRDAGGSRFVLRRPPLGSTLESAHDMGREHRILSALWGSAVPVPEPYAYCDDEEVNDGPFYLMEFLDGVVLRDPQDVEAAFGPADRSRLTGSLTDTLAAIHTVDPDAAGLGDLGPRADYLGRQLRRWTRQYEQVRGRDIPEIDEVHRLLVARKPRQQRDTIVHGDYRIDNVIFGSDTEVLGVLDWELCTLGDPLADLGGLLVQWVEKGEDGAHMLGRTPTRLSGFPPRSDVVKQYASVTGLDVSDVDYYVAFAYWRLACIGEGVYVRHRDGAMGPDHDPELVDLLGGQVKLLADRALATIG